jgi:hypothetical protein
MPALDDEREKLLSEWNSVSLDSPAVEKLVAESQTSIMYLHRAARLEKCDWGLDYDDGISLLLPHLSRSRDLARLAALHARYELKRGNTRALRDDATAMIVLARHVGRDPMMVGLLVRFGIEDMVVDLVAPHVPNLKVGYAGAREVFESLPPSSRMYDTLAAEKKYFLEWIARKIKEEEKRDPGAGMRLWNNMLGPDGPEELKKVQSAAEAIKLTEGLFPVYDEMEKLVVLPPAEFESKYRAFKQQTAASNSLSAFLVPQIDTILGKERRSQARVAMLLAAIAVAEGGPDQLKNIEDPFGDGPFEFRKLENGFELKSQLTFEGKPVTLTVGQKKD